MNRMSDARAGDSRGFRFISPLRDFVRTEASGGVVLVVAALAALVWANSPLQDSYRELWSTVFTIGFPEHHISLTLQGWVNDGLMAVFFFVVGLEIKRELVEGELREPRKAALPAIAALGGMVVPALLYLAFTAGGTGDKGWGIPMATDIAIAIGVLSLLSSRVSPSLKLFVLALAIVDDIGAIIVIAVFYSHGFEWEAALVALALLVAMLALRRLGVRSIIPFVVIGAGFWLAIYETGIHATIAGVVLGLLAPTRPFRQDDMIDVDALLDLSTVEAAEESVVIARESVSIVEWLEHRLHPWSSFVIVPLFALANAGVLITSRSVSNALTSAVTYGIVIGLVIGKIVGIAGFGWLGIRFGLGALPDGMSKRDLVGVAALGGIGFTVSLLVTELAFAGRLANEAKIGILVASIVAAVVGTLILARPVPDGDHPV
jgi:Na+:H+ antiporter, NhaA family